MDALNLARVFVPDGSHGCRVVVLAVNGGAWTIDGEALDGLQSVVRVEFYLPGEFEKGEPRVVLDLASGSKLAVNGKTATFTCQFHVATVPNENQETKNEVKIRSTDVIDKKFKFETFFLTGFDVPVDVHDGMTEIHGKVFDTFPNPIKNNLGSFGLFNPDNFADNGAEQLTGWCPDAKAPLTVLTLIKERSGKTFAPLSRVTAIGGFEFKFPWCSGNFEARYFADPRLAGRTAAADLPRLRRSRFLWLPTEVGTSGDVQREHRERIQAVLSLPLENARQGVIGTFGYFPRSLLPQFTFSAPPEAYALVFSRLQENPWKAFEDGQFVACGIQGVSSQSLTNLVVPGNSLGTVTADVSGKPVKLYDGSPGETCFAIEIEGECTLDTKGNAIPWNELAFRPATSVDEDAKLTLKVSGRLPFALGSAPVPGQTTVDLEIDRLPLADLRPSGVAPEPDEGVAQSWVAPPGAATDTGLEQTIARALNRFPPVVFATAGKGEEKPVGALSVRERYEPGRDRQLTLTVRRTGTVNRAGGAERERSERVVVLDQAPFLAARAEMTPLLDGGVDSVEVVAVWRASSLEGSKWEIAAAGDGVSYAFPAQAIGEGAEKGARFPEAVPVDKPVPYRFGMPARVEARTALVTKRYQEAPWNTRRVFGYPNQRAPGVAVDRFTTELLYGMRTEVDGARVPFALNLAELASRVGGLAPPLRFETQDQYKGDDDQGGKDPRPRYSSVQKHRGQWAHIHQAFNHRLAVLELWNRGENPRSGGDVELKPATGVLTLGRGVGFRLRPQADLRWPFNEPVRDDEISGPATEAYFAKRTPRKTTVPPETDQAWRDRVRAAMGAGLPGGAIWGFESRRILKELLDEPEALPDTGLLSRPYITALGGSGYQRAVFSNGKTILYSDTNIGRLSYYAVERIGRIGVLWNRAKHVIVYCRSTLPGKQFANDPDFVGREHLGRPVVRKVQEYVELLELERAFPEKGSNRRAAGCTEASIFADRIIPVNGRWGRDVEQGWEIPLWNPDADQSVYRKPAVALRLAGAEGEHSVLGYISKPQHLYFFTATTAKLSGDTDVWGTFAGVDFTSQPLPETDDGSAYAPKPGGRLPDVPKVPAGFERWMFELDELPNPVNLQHNRHEGRCSAKLASVGLMRAAPAPLDRVPPQDSSVATLREAVGQYQKAAEWVKSAGDDLAAINARAATLQERLAAWKGAQGGKLTDACNFREKIKEELEAAGADVVKQLAEGAEGELFRKLEDLRGRVGVAFDGARDAVKAAKGDWDNKKDQIKQAVDSHFAHLAEVIQQGEDLALVPFAQLVAAAKQISVKVGAVKGTWDAWDKTTAESLNNFIASYRSELARFSEQLPAGGDPRLVALKAIVARVAGKLDAVGREAGGNLKMKEGIGAAITSANGWAGTLESSVVNLKDSANGACKGISQLLPVGDGGLRKDLADMIDSAKAEQLEKLCEDIDALRTSVDVQLQGIAKAAPEKLGKAIRANAANWIRALVQVAGLGSEILETQCKELLGGLENTLEKLAKAGDDAVQALAKQLEDQSKQWQGQIEEFGKTAESYIRNKLGRAPSFQNPDETLRLVAAVTNGPLLPNLGCNRDLLLCRFDDLDDAIRTSPIAVLANRVGQDLESLGLEMPSTRLFNGLEFDPGQVQRLKRLLNSFAGLKGMFADVIPKNLGGDAVKIAHGFDQKSQQAWLKASVDYRMPGSERVFSFGPIEVLIAKSAFIGEASFRAGRDGVLTPQRNASVQADWTLSVGGSRLVTFRDTKLVLDNQDHMDFQLDPSKIELDAALQWISDVAKTAPATNKGKTFWIEPVYDKRNGLPKGMRAVLDLEVPKIGAAAVVLSGIRIGAAFELSAVPKFSLAASFNLGSRDQPFTLLVAFMGGGGWVEAQARYYPDTGEVMTRVLISLGAMAGAAAALGPVSGEVYFRVGSSVQYISGDPFARSGLTIAVYVQIAGRVSLLSIAVIGLSLTLSLETREDQSIVGTGVLRASARISCFFEVNVEEAVSHPISGGGARTSEELHEQAVRLSAHMA